MRGSPFLDGVAQMEVALGDEPVGLPIYAAVARRCALLTAAGLAGIAAVHLIEGPGSLSYELYVGVLELALAAASVPLAMALVIRPVRDLWIVASALVWLALGLFLASRSIGLSGSTADIGNWGQTLGITNMATEAAAIALAAWALRHWRGERS
jgi:hypothetical protein